MSIKFNKTTLGGTVMSVVLAFSSLIFASPASAAAYTLTCSQTGATATPFTLTINNASDEVVKESAKDCGGALVVPEGVRRIDFGAFVPWDSSNHPLSNPNITSISLPSTLETIHVGGLINLSNVTELTIPASVTGIASQAFQGMTSLTHVLINGSSSNTPTTIGYYALNFANLDLEFGSGKVILEASFGSGSTIRTLNLGTGMLSIGANAFSNQRFSDLTIPPSVTTISQQAFSSMANLHEVKFGATTPGITSIHDSAFSGTTITSVQYCGGNTVLDTYLAANLPNADVYCDTTVLAAEPSIAQITPANNSVVITVLPGAENNGSAPRNYEVQYSTDEVTWTSFTRTPASTSTQVAVPNLVNETSYKFRVAAINPAGTSTFSAASATVAPMAPRYGITYVAGAGSGTVPVESSTFLPGSTATLLAPINLHLDSFTFSGWSDGTSLYPAGATFTVDALDAVLTAQWVQNSLYGIDAADLSEIGRLTAGSIDTTLSGSSDGTAFSVGYLSGSLPTSSIIKVFMLARSNRAGNLIAETNNFLLSLVVSWLAPDGTVPLTAANKPITLTIANSLIKKGASAFALVGDTATLLGTATVDGSITIQITEDPEIIIAISKPAAPTGIAAQAGQGATAMVSWTAPSNNGGADVTSYLVTSSGGQTCTTTTTTCMVTGLGAGSSYTFTVSAVNSSGAGVQSSASNAISIASQGGSGTSSSTPVVTTPEQSTPVVTAPEQPAPIIATPAKSTKWKKVAFGFAPGSAKLTTQMKVSLTAWAKSWPKATSVSCVGYTGGPTILKRDVRLSVARAKAVCNQLKVLSPSLEFVSAKGIQSKQLGARMRKVDISITNG